MLSVEYHQNQIQMMCVTDCQDDTGARKNYEKLLKYKQKTTKVFIISLLTLYVNEFEFRLNFPHLLNIQNSDELMIFRPGLVLILLV